jgi:hypothetical protein
MNLFKSPSVGFDLSHIFKFYLFYIFNLLRHLILLS